MLKSLGLGTLLLLFSLTSGSGQALPNSQEIGYWGKVKIPAPLRQRFISDLKCYGDFTYLKSCAHALQSAASLMPNAMKYELSEETLRKMLEQKETRLSFEQVIENISQKANVPPDMVWGHAISAHLQEYDPGAELIPAVADGSTEKESTQIKSYVADVQNKIGVVEIPSFESDLTCLQAQVEIERLQKSSTEKIVLDLRENKGGRRLQALCVTGLFLGLKKLAGVRDALAPIPDVDELVPRVRRSKDVVWIGGNMLPQTQAPLAVWLSKKSSGSAEIVAGALQEYHRAIVIGERTHGRAKSRVTKKIPGTSLALHFTSEEVILPSGRSYQDEGLTPDLELDWQKPEASAKALQVWPPSVRLP